MRACSDFRSGVFPSFIPKSAFIRAGRTAFEGLLKANSDLRIEVQGHTDSTGAAERNRELSLERAQSVAAALRLYGVEASRLVPRGFGPDQPVADNAPEEGRQQNRHVELVRIE